MCESSVGHHQTVPTNEAIKPGVDAIRAGAVVRVLKDHFGTGVAHIERLRVQIGPTGEPDFMHLETHAGFQTDALLGGFDRFPTFPLKQGNDLRGGNKGVAGGTKPRPSESKYRQLLDELIFLLLPRANVTIVVGAK